MQTPPLPRIAGLDDEQVDTLRSSLKSYPQFCESAKNLLAGVCPFCDPLKPINVPFFTVGEGTDYAWRMWHNPFPIMGKDKNGNRIVAAEVHVVWAPVRHVVDPNELTEEDWQHMAAMTRHAFSKDGGSGLNIKGGELIRFGPSAYNEKSVTHLHGNGIMPNRLAEVRLPLAKHPDEVAESYKILEAFAKMYNGIDFEDLDPDEKTLVEDRVVAP